MQQGLLKEFIKDGALTLRASGDCMVGTFPDGAELLIKRRALYLPSDVLNRRYLEARERRRLMVLLREAAVGADSSAIIAAKADPAIEADPTDRLASTTHRFPHRGFE